MEINGVLKDFLALSNLVSLSFSLPNGRYLTNLRLLFKTFFRV